MQNAVRIIMLVIALTAAYVSNSRAEITITPTYPLAGEIPEDTEISADGTRLFASFFPANRVANFDLATLQSDSSVDIVAPTGMQALQNGDLLVATAPWFQGVVLTGAPDATLASKQGVWRISPDGLAEQIASLPFENVLPNGIAVDAIGNTYVSNLIGNEIYRVDPAGEVSVWLQDDIFVRPELLTMLPSKNRGADWRILRSNSNDMAYWLPEHCCEPLLRHPSLSSGILRVAPKCSRSTSTRNFRRSLMTRRVAATSYKDGTIRLSMPRQALTLEELGEIGHAIYSAVRH